MHWRNPRSVNRRWPDPGDSAVDRARQIAYSYRQLAHEVAPERCEALDRAARYLGEVWIAPQIQTIADGELVSTAYAAELLGVDEATTRSWGSRSHVPVTRYKGGWSMEELMAYQVSQRRRRRGHR